MQGGDAGPCRIDCTECLGSWRMTEHLSIPGPARCCSWVWMDLDGVEEERKMAGRILESGSLPWTLHQVAMHPISGSCGVPSLRPSKLAPMKINEDIAVPLDRQADCIRFTELAARTGLLMQFSVTRDGNLHVNFMITLRQNRGRRCQALYRGCPSRWNDHQTRHLRQGTMGRLAS